MKCLVATDTRCEHGNNLQELDKRPWPPVDEQERYRIARGRLGVYEMHVETALVVSVATIGFRSVVRHMSGVARVAVATAVETAMHLLRHGVCMWKAVQCVSYRCAAEALLR